MIRFNAECQDAARRYGRLAALCGLSGTARALASALVRLRESLGLPGRLGTPLDIPAAARAALEDPCTPSNPRPVSAGDLEALLKEVV